MENRFSESIRRLKKVGSTKSGFFHRIEPSLCSINKKGVTNCRGKIWPIKSCSLLLNYRSASPIRQTGGKAILDRQEMIKICVFFCRELEHFDFVMKVYEFDFSLGRFFTYLFFNFYAILV